MEQKIKVGMVEDQFLFRQGMRAILAAWPEIEIVFESSEGYTVIEKLKITKDLPHVMLIDLSLPPDGEKAFTGRKLTTVLRENYPNIGIIILSGHSDDSSISELIELGAHGYLIKACDPQEVYDAIQSVHFKGVYINAQALRAISKRHDHVKSKKTLNESPLSDREVEVLQLICEQNTSEEIAEKLFISPKTVNTHRNNLLAKTEARNVAGLVIHAIKNGIVNL